MEKEEIPQTEFNVHLRRNGEWKYFENVNSDELKINDVRFGEGCRVGKMVMVGDGVRVGNRVTLGRGVTLCDGVRLEDDVKVGQGAWLGTGVTVKTGVTVGAWVTLLDMKTEKEWREEASSLLLSLGLRRS